MKVHVTGRNSEMIMPLLSEHGIVVSTDNPEAILAFGGDGTLLAAVRDFPDKPVFPVRDNARTPLCDKHSSYGEMLGMLAARQLSETKLMKLEGVCGAHRLVGVNDIFVHHLNQAQAIRYKVDIDGEPYGHEVVADGVGVATVHGSTAYYRSITHSVFKLGIGLAFSNSTEPTNHLVLPETAKIRVKITRGPGLMVADNGPEKVQLGDGSVISISKTGEFARILGYDMFMCTRCRRLRHPRE